MEHTITDTVMTKTYKPISSRTVRRIKKLIGILKSNPHTTNEELMRMFKLRSSSLYRLRKFAIQYGYATHSDIYPHKYALVEKIISPVVPDTPIVPVVPVSVEIKSPTDGIEDWLVGLPEYRAEPKPVGSDINQILDQRHSTYGTFLGQASLSQDIKKVINERLKGKADKFSPDQLEALSMFAHKIARVVNGDPNYVDSWRDIAGYAQLIVDRLEGRVR